MVVEQGNKNEYADLTEGEKELYDRQIRLWGLDTQKRLRAAKVLISGLNGVGAELTKNIILSGVHSVCLHDDKLVTEEDFIAQFLVQRKDLGKNRAVSSVERAKSLNPMVILSTDVEPLKTKNSDFFYQFDVVIVLDTFKDELIRVDAICREKNIGFFTAHVWGIFGFCFADLNHHKFIEDLVKYKQTSEPNEKHKTETILVPIHKELQYPPITTLFEFNYKATLLNRKIKPSRSAFHLLKIMHTFQQEYGRNPSYKQRDEDISKLKKIRDEHINETIVPMSCLMHLFCEISPTAAIIGGILGQEVVKAITKKEAPHRNLFIFDPETCCGFVETTVQ